MIKIINYLKEEQISLALKATNKEEAIRELARLLKDKEEIIDFDTFLKDVFEREKLGTTGIGDGVALPHARSTTVKDFVISFGRSKGGIDFKALDNKPVKLIFLMGTPQKNVGGYLKILAHLSRLLQKKSFKEALLQAESPSRVMEVFKEFEK